MCQSGGMRIGILGGTGPAGTALGLRLASIGYEVVIGSRSADKALEVVAAEVEKFPELSALMFAGDNEA